MHRTSSIISVALLAASTLGSLSGSALARGAGQPQLCSLGGAGVGQPQSVICKNVATGATTQTIAAGTAAAGSGATGGTFSHRGDVVLVTNIVGGATLFHESHGQLISPVSLRTGGESSLSGAVGENGVYVLTGTRLLFFPHGQSQFQSSRALLVADGSAAQVTLAGGFAYVSEKTGSLEAFALGRDGSLIGSATAVAGVPAGVIVGIAGHDDLVVAPVAHLASNANQATIPVVSGTELIQLVPTKEVAACWTASSADAVCVTNPGSMTVSCGTMGPGGLSSYTSAAASVTGESLFDIDIRHDVVGMLGKSAGAPVLVAYSRSGANGDFLELLNQFPLGTAAATGALVLPPLSR